MIQNEMLREKNFSCFEKRYRRRPVIDQGEDGKYRMEEAKSGSPVLCVRVSEDGRTAWIPMNSLYDPGYEAERWAMSYDPPNRRLTFAMQGFAAGYQLRALLKYLRQDTEFFIFEPEEGLFSFVCAFIDLTDIIADLRVHIFLKPDRYRFQNALKQDIIPWNTETIGTRLPFYQENEDFNEAFRTACALLVTNTNYQRIRGRRTLVNRLHAWISLHRNHTLDALLSGLPKDIPVIIAAGGPSLNKNVEDLREAQGHALIVCIDRAFKTLLKHGILPDLIATVDVDKSPAYLVNDTDIDTEQIPMLCSFKANYESQRMFDGRNIYFCAWNEENALPGINGRLPLQGVVGGNVAAACYTTFAENRQKTVILIGQDLANLGSETHADGSDDGASVNDSFIEVEGIDGKPVQSHEDWIHFRDYYEEMIVRWPETRVIDATEGGALIHGSKVMTLKDAIHKECTGDFSFRDLYEHMPHAQTVSAHEATIGIYEKWISELDDTVRLAGMLGEECRQLLDAHNTDVSAGSGDGMTVSDLPGDEALESFIKLRNEIRSKEVFGFLADSWISDRTLLPDRNILYRNRRELDYVLERELAFADILKEAAAGLRAEMDLIIHDPAA